MVYVPQSKENSTPQHQQYPTKATAQKFSDDQESTTASLLRQTTMASSPQQQKLKSTAQMMDNRPQVTAQLALQSKMESSSVVQQKTLQRIEDEDPLQPEFETEPAQREVAAEAPHPNNTGLPDNLKSGIENLSGMTMDHVRVHYNSSKPTQLQAHAYAQGSEIHVAPGQEQHLPHEAWHVVQQAQGRVKPRVQMKGGMEVNDDADLEKEADIMGDMALQVLVSGSKAMPETTENPAGDMPIQGKFSIVQLGGKSPVTDKTIDLATVLKEGVSEGDDTTILSAFFSNDNNWGKCVEAYKDNAMVVKKLCTWRNNKIKGLVDILCQSEYKIKIVLLQDLPVDSVEPFFLPITTSTGAGSQLAIEKLHATGETWLKNPLGIALGIWPHLTNISGAVSDSSTPSKTKAPETSKIIDLSTILTEEESMQDDIDMRSALLENDNNWKKLVEGYKENPLVVKKLCGWRRKKIQKIADDLKDSDYAINITFSEEFPTDSVETFILPFSIGLGQNSSLAVEKIQSLSHTFFKNPTGIALGILPHLKGKAVENTSESTSDSSKSMSSNLIRGLPNARKVDCFLNATLQVLAGPYRELFDPAANVIIENSDIQILVWGVIQKINKVESTEDIGADEIVQLRAFLQGKKFVERLTGHEDAAEVMTKLLNAVMKLSGRNLIIPDQIENTTIKAGPADSLTSLAQRFNTTADAIAVANQIVNYDNYLAHQTGERRVTIDLKKQTGVVDTGKKNLSDYSLGYSALPEISLELIMVDVDRYSTLDGFLYEQYGKAGQLIEYSDGVDILHEGQVKKIKQIRQVFNFSHLPQVLTFNAKRFQMGTYGPQKNSKAFKMPEELCLVDKSGGGKTYQLVAEVVHTGGLSGGHYYAHKKVKEDWLNANDERISAESGPKGDLNQGYIYTYQVKEAFTKTDAATKYIPQNKGNEKEKDFAPSIFDFGGPSGDSSKSKEKNKSKVLRGLPNATKVDCFINAVLQIMAGPYKELFNPAVNTFSPKFVELQAPLWGLLGKINKVTGSEDVGAKEVQNLRQLLLTHQLVKAETGQEDASELMIKLVNLSLDFVGRQIQVDAIGTKYTIVEKDSLETIASAKATTVEKLLAWNPGTIVDPAKYTFAVKRVRSFKPEDARALNSSESPKGDVQEYIEGTAENVEPTAAMLTVDVNNYNSLNSYLYKRFGVGEAINYDDKNLNQVQQGNSILMLSKVTEQYIFMSLPEVMTFYLQRFNLGKDAVGGGATWQKNNKAFYMPEQLFLIERSKSGNEVVKEYALVGEVIQTGTLAGGHYRAYRKENNQWLEADDDKIYGEISLGREINEGYIYSYQMIKEVARDQVKESTYLPQKDAAPPASEEFSSWLSLLKDVSVGSAKASGKLKSALGLYALQAFYTNAFYSAHELARFQYQTTPVNYQDHGAYLRAHISSFVQALKGSMPEFNTAEVFLVRNTQFKSTLNQLFQAVPVANEQGIKSGEVDALIEKLSGFAIKQKNVGNLDDYAKGKTETQAFIDISQMLEGIGESREIRDKAREFSKRIMNHIFESIRDKLIDAFVVKNLSGKGDLETLKGELKGYFKNSQSPEDMPTFFAALKEQATARTDDAHRKKVEEYELDVGALGKKEESVRYKKYMADFREYIRKTPKQESGVVDSSAVDREKLIKNPDVEAFANLTSTLEFDVFLRGLSEKVNAKPAVAMPDLEKELGVIITTVGRLQKTLPSAVFVGGNVTIEEQPVIITPDVSDKVTKQIEWALNKAGQIPTPTSASRKLLEKMSLGEAAQRIIEEQLKMERGNQTVVQKLQGVLGQLAAFDPDRHPTIAPVTGLLEKVNKQLAEVNSLVVSEEAYVRVLSSSLGKLIAQCGMLDESLKELHPFILPRLHENLASALKNANDIKVFTRNIQNIHELVILALDYNRPKDLQEVQVDDGKVKNRQGPFIMDYGLKAFADVYNAALAQSTGEKFHTEAYYNIYFELAQKLSGSSKHDRDKVTFSSPKVIPSSRDSGAKRPDVVMIDIHPNDANQPEMHMFQITELITGLFPKEVDDKDQAPVTTIIDITLNHIGEKEVAEIRQFCQPYIGKGWLNLVFIQSLTKFAQFGMDKHSGGLLYYYNLPEKWGKFNASIASAIGKDKVDSAITSYFELLFQHTAKEQQEYIREIRKNTKSVYDQLKENFELVRKNLKAEKGITVDIMPMQVSESDDPGTCYVAFNYGEFASKVFGSKVTDKHKEDLNKTILEGAIYKIMENLNLPMSMRQSFGFPISNLGDTGENLRFTVGLETQETFAQYVKIITYVNAEVASTKVADLQTEEERTKFLKKIVEPVKNIEFIEGQLTTLLKRD